MGADAGWSSCPEMPAPNQVCSDTYIYAADVVYRQDGSKFPSKTLSFNQYKYTCDDQCNYIYLSSTYGTGDAALNIDKKLKNASASATVPLVTCTVDADWNETCVDAGTAVVNASWIGQGNLEKSKSTYQYSSSGFTYKGMFRGSWRFAAATAQVNGANLGAAYWANLFDTRSHDMYISH